MSDCEEIRDSLGAWLDGELSPADASRVQSHLDRCPLCLGEVKGFERIQDTYKTFMESRVSNVAFEPFWTELRGRIERRRSWRAEFVNWFQVALPPPRLGWAIPLVILLFLGILSVERIWPPWDSSAKKTNLAAVETIDAHGLNVAVFRESKTKTTIIWLFQNQETENEASAEPTATSPSF